MPMDTLMYDLLIVFSKWTEKIWITQQNPSCPHLHFAHLPSTLKTFADCIEGHGLSLCKNPKYYHQHTCEFIFALCSSHEWYAVCRVMCNHLICTFREGILLVLSISWLLWWQALPRCSFLTGWISPSSGLW